PVDASPVAALAPSQLGLRWPAAENHLLFSAPSCAASGRALPVEGGRLRLCGFAGRNGWVRAYPWAQSFRPSSAARRPCTASRIIPYASDTVGECPEGPFASRRSSPRGEAIMPVRNDRGADQLLVERCLADHPAAWEKLAERLQERAKQVLTRALR